MRRLRRSLVSTNTSDEQDGSGCNADQRRSGADRIDDRACECVAERQSRRSCRASPRRPRARASHAGCGSAAPSPRPSRRCRPRTPPLRMRARSTRRARAGRAAAAQRRSGGRAARRRTAGRSSRTRSMNRPPSSIPTENPVRISPQAKAPPSSRLATTGPMTSNGATTSIRKRHALSSPSHSQRCLRTSSKPARNSVRKRVPRAPLGRAQAQRREAGCAHGERAGVERHRAAGGDEADEDAAERRAQAARDGCA